MEKVLSPASSQIDYFALSHQLQAIVATSAHSGGLERAHLLGVHAWYVRQLDTEAALALSDESARLLDCFGGGMCSLSARLLLIRAEVDWLRGNPATGIELSRKAQQAFEGSQDEIGAGDAILLRHLIQAEVGAAGPDSFDASEALAAYWRAGDATRHALAIGMQALLTISSGKWKASLASWRALGPSNDPLLQIIDRMLSGLASKSDGDYARTLEIMRPAVDQLREVGWLQWAIVAATTLSAACSNLNDREGSLDWAHRALDIARSCRPTWPTFLGKALSYCAKALRDAGQFNAAETLVCEARRVWEPFGSSRGYAVACLFHGEVLLDLAQPARALDSFGECARAGEALGHLADLVGPALCGQAEALSRLNRPIEAMAAVQRAMSIWNDPERHFVYLPECFRVQACIARTHNLPLPAGSTAASAALHFQEAGLRHATRLWRIQIPADWLSEISRDYEAVGDLRNALHFERLAAASRLSDQERKATDMAVALRVKHETERAKADSLHHEALARSEALRADAEAAANRAKSSFLANVSHELRSPLNAMLGFSRLLLRDGSLGDQARRDLSVVLRSGEHLYALINQVLELSKIEAGRMVLQVLPFDLQELLFELKDLFNLAASQKGLALVVSMEPGVPRWVAADAGKLRQVLVNLMSNAVKFTMHGRVELLVRKTASDAKTHRLSICVTDTGVGISPDELDSLGQAFSQAAAGRAAAEGSGLGLAISRGFVQLMGGELRLDSQSGLGTSATFEIDVRTAHHEQVSRQSRARRVLGLSPGCRECRILVADDWAESRQLLIRLLAPLGFEVREAVDGEQAVNEWRRWRPHLVLMDMRMPIMDGREATRLIKAEDPSGGTVVVALTASSFEEQAQEIMALGCDDFLRKPFEEHVLLETIARHLKIDLQYARGPAAEPLLDITRLAALPPELKRVLRQALQNLDVSAVDQALAAIHKFDPRLAEELSIPAQEYRYERMLEALDVVQEQNRPVVPGA